MIYFIIVTLIALGFIANKNGKLTEYLGIVAAGITGYLVFKKNPADATLKAHDETTDKVASLDKIIADNVTTIAVEEQKQKDIQKDIANAKETDNSLDTLVDFFNKR